eukprot:scaffold655_cov379-Prasinococcus_capsulatus_cf.AAC.25
MVLSSPLACNATPAAPSPAVVARANRSDSSSRTNQLIWPASFHPGITACPQPVCAVHSKFASLCTDAKPTANGHATPRPCRRERPGPVTGENR